MGGFQRTYLVHLPPTYDPAQPAPLLIGFHGGGDTGAGFQSFARLEESTDSLGFVVVYPDGFVHSWAIGCNCTDAEQVGVDDMAFVDSLIAHLHHQLNIDESRVYVTGFSQGGLLAHLLGCALAYRLAAAASVGALMLTEVAQSCSPGEPLPMMFIQGTADPAFPWGGDAGQLSGRATVDRWIDLNGCDPAGRTVTELPDIVSDGTRTTVETYAVCDQGAEVKAYIVEGGGHTWPSSPFPFRPGNGPLSHDFSASEALAGFFAAHHGDLE